MNQDRELRSNTSYQISGFRSLIDFKINLEPGLNVLVGPNGSGKTNFIEFLDFLDNFMLHGASAAVSSSGGLSRVFSIENIRKSSPALMAKVASHATIYNVIEKTTVRSEFNFEYEIEIKYSRATSSIYVSRELLRLYKVAKDGEPSKPEGFVGAISIIRRNSSEDNKPTIRLGPKLLADNPRNPLSIRDRFSSQNRLLTTLQEKIDFESFENDTSILSQRYRVPALDAIRISLARGRSFNINPTRAREPDDLIRPPGIGRDGSGLSSTLHAMQMAKRNQRRSRYSRARNINPDTLDMVVMWTQLVFPDLKGIHVSQDPHTGKFLGSFIIGGKELRVPLQAASDGTLKWLAFVSLLTTAGGAYSIEEPENFLHPKMQQFIVRLIRDALLEDINDEYFILSTHSETLINECIPEELIIFSFEDGSTACKRLSNPEAVAMEIQKTGFSLGHYYAKNAIS